MNGTSTSANQQGQIASGQRQSAAEPSQLPQPTSLLKARQFESTLSPDQIKTFAKTGYQNPVISLYLQLNAEKVVPRGKALLRFFHSMKERVLADRTDWIETLSKDQRKQLRDDLDEIEVFLSDHTSPENVHSVIIFKSGTELNRVITLPVRMRDHLAIDVDPYITPLESALEENEKVLFVEISWTESLLALYHLGYYQEIGRIKPSIPPQPVDGDTRDAARRRLTHFEWHLKNTAKHALDWFRFRSCQALVLMGEERVEHFLEKYLHESLSEKVIDRIYSAPANDRRPRKELIERAIHEHQSAKEAQAIEKIRSYKPGEELVSGLRDVMDACNLFLVRGLFVADGVPAKGFECRERHYLSFADEECPLCGKKLVAVDNLLDEVVRFALLHGAGVTVFENQPNLLAEYEGVAAVLYPRANAA
jgi:peptide subunit release factor 1 (eRF1)